MTPARYAEAPETDHALAIPTRELLALAFHDGKVHEEALRDLNDAQLRALSKFLLSAWNQYWPYNEGSVDIQSLAGEQTPPPQTPVSMESSIVVGDSPQRARLNLRGLGEKEVMIRAIQGVLHLGESQILLTPYQVARTLQPEKSSTESKVASPWTEARSIVERDVATLSILEDFETMKPLTKVQSFGELLADRMGSLTQMLRSPSKVTDGAEHRSPTTPGSPTAPATGAAISRSVTASSLPSSVASPNSPSSKVTVGSHEAVELLERLHSFQVSQSQVA